MTRLSIHTATGHDQVGETVFPGHDAEHLLAGVRGHLAFGSVATTARKPEAGPKHRSGLGDLEGPVAELPRPSLEPHLNAVSDRLTYQTWNGNPSFT